ncbi:MAG TPA: hypothetical protein PLM63_00010 [bacterium]|jgi:hypothetical protein|nr:hypothetical protein [bacterium]HPO10960.1 hypothetical protein [bacterium]
MEKFNQDKIAKYGNVLHSWYFKEFEEYHRGTLWYIIFIAVIVVLAIYCFKTSNFLFLIIVIMFVMLEVMFKFKKPNDVLFAIYESGILYESYFYFWDEIKEYYIIYDVDRNVKRLYFIFKKTRESSLCIDLENQNPVVIRETLNKYIKENLDRKYERFGDQLSRILKL